MTHGRALAMAMLAAAAVSTAPAVRADDSKDCIAASTQAQQLRDDGRYRRARDQLNVCSRDVCPALVKQACLGWLSDLESTWPSVVVNAKDDSGADLVDVTVVVDGTPLVAKLDGKPQLVDPGEHDFHYETGGYPPVDEHVVIHAGEKSRVLSVQFGGGKKPTKRGGGGAGGGGGRGGGSETPVAGWVFGGLALVSFGVEAAVGIPAFSDRNALENDACKTTATCDASKVDSIHTRFIVSDVLGAVGIVSAGIAIYFFATAGSSSQEPPKAARVDVRPLPGGGALAGWSWTF
jgi:hypothetical protein